MFHLLFDTVWFQKHKLDKSTITIKKYRSTSKSFERVEKWVDKFILMLKKNPCTRKKFEKVKNWIGKFTLVLKKIEIHAQDLQNLCEKCMLLKKLCMGLKNIFCTKINVF